MACNPNKQQPGKEYFGCPKCGCKEDIKLAESLCDNESCNLLHEDDLFLCGNKDCNELFLGGEAEIVKREVEVEFYDLSLKDSIVRYCYFLFKNKTMSFDEALLEAVKLHVKLKNEAMKNKIDSVVLDDKNEP